MRRWAALIILSGAIWFLDGFGWFNWLKGPITGLVQPVRRSLYLFKSKDDSSEARIESTEKLVLKAELIKLEGENKRLRELLGAPLPPSWKFVPANILKLENEMMVIDAGSEQGISEDEMVMGLVDERINNGILLGRVREVWVWQAEVELLSAEGLEVRVKTEAGVKGKVRGDGERVRLVEVLQKHQLNEGELILTEGKDGWLLDLVVGEVGEIESRETAVFQETEVIPIINMNQLDKVWVVRLPLEN